MRTNQFLAFIGAALLAQLGMPTLQALAQAKQETGAKAEKSNVRVLSREKVKAREGDAVVLQHPAELSSRIRTTLAGSVQGDTATLRRLSRSLPTDVRHIYVNGTASALAAVTLLESARDSLKTGKNKIRILKKEDGEFYLLDTTLALSSGVSLEETMKQWEKDGITLKSLGAKVIKPVEMKAAKGMEAVRLFPSLAGDTTRRKMIQIFQADSLLSSMSPSMIFRTDSLRGALFRSEGAKALRIAGNPSVLRSVYRMDSLLKGHRILSLDSILQLKADTFLLKETIRVIKADENGEVKVIGLRGKGGSSLLKEGEYEVIQLRRSGPGQIIVLTPSKVSSERMTETIKQGKKIKQEESSDLSLLLSPNPSSGKVKVSFTVPNKTKAQLRVSDSQGKNVYKEDLGTINGLYSRELDLSTLGKGVFVIQVQVGKTTRSGKLLVQ